MLSQSGGSKRGAWISSLKKLKTASFAAQVNRDDINDALSRINVSIEEIIQFIIDHQKDV